MLWGNGVGMDMFFSFAIKTTSILCSTRKGRSQGFDHMIHMLEGYFIKKKKDDGWDLCCV